MFSEFKKNWFWSLVAETSTRLGSLTLFTLYYNYLPRETSGDILTTYGYAITAWLIIDLGLGIYGTKIIAEDIRPAYEIQVQITISRILLFIVGVVLFYYLNSLRSSVNLNSLFFFSIYLLFRAISAEWVLRGQARFKEYAIIALSSSIIQLITGGILFCFEVIESFAALPWLTYALSLAIGSWMVTRNKGTVIQKNNLLFKSIMHVRYSYQFSLANGLSVLFQQSPVLISSIIFNTGSISGFLLAHRFLLSGVTFFQVIGNVIFPKLVKDYSKSKVFSILIVMKSSLLVLALVVLMSVIAVLITIIMKVNPASFLNIDNTVLAALVIFFTLRSLRVITSKQIFAINLQKKYSILIGICTFIYFVILIIAYTSNNLTIIFIAVLYAVTEALIYLLSLLLLTNLSKKNI